MNTSELIEHIQTHVITIAALNGEPGHILWESDGVIHVEGPKVALALRPDAMLSTYQNANWEVYEQPVIKIDPESGCLLCPECGKTMTAVFSVTAQHLAMVDEACEGEEVIYDHDLAGQDYEAVLDEIACNGCHFAVVANGFTLDKAEWQAKHPTSEWKV